ncbi:hypothetical protein M2283_009817 [Streptomyces pseudovenezuelae]|uniref:Uncharacterized protein n=1 Tax=Streptomyces pseudovenezuelae TaxID=67350 RepID=A0ABT6M1P4_9ACTN|nr:hypothetical protein [Streptomyces pseudovenezuelae]
MCNERAEANLRRVRQENTDLWCTLALDEKAVRQFALENDALRLVACVLPLPARPRQAPTSRS